MTPQHQAFFHVPTCTVSYLLWDEASNLAAVIDPVLDYDPKSAKVSTGSADEVLAFAAERGLNLRYVLETHAHADHLTAADHIRGKTGAALVISEHITQVQAHFAQLFEADDVRPDGDCFDRLVRDAETLELGETRIGVMETPGHTAANITYLTRGAAFVGDTLFMPDYGVARTDFPGGDAATLYRSIRKILDLPPETKIYVGHDYLPDGRAAFAWETTVADQRARNVQIHDGVSEDDFVRLRRARDAALPAPVLLWPALQVNIRGGRFPPPSPKGRVFLRLPVSFG